VIGAAFMVAKIATGEAECRQAKAVAERAMQEGPVKYVCVEKAVLTRRPAE
jgi:hypothetical protein